MIMNYVELAVLFFFGSLLIMVGTEGLQVYAKSFQNSPSDTLSADVLLSIVKGPHIVPLVLCAMTILGGIFFVALPVYMLIVNIYQSIGI